MEDLEFTAINVLLFRNCDIGNQYIHRQY